MKKTFQIQLDFASVSIYENYMISVIDEGITLRAEHNETLKDIAHEYFFEIPFVYITHRKNSYAVDPTLYMETSKINNLVGLAVVSKEPTAKSSVHVEKLFYDKLFVHFNDLQEAIDWAQKVTQNPPPENQLN